MASRLVWIEKENSIATMGIIGSRDFLCCGFYFLGFDIYLKKARQAEMEES